MPREILTGTYLNNEEIKTYSLKESNKRKNIYKKAIGHCCMPDCNFGWGLHVHHIFLISQGGTDDFSNYIVLCGKCHAKRRVHLECRRNGGRISPMVIRLLIDRLIMYGVLPEVPEYIIQWPDLGVPTEKEAAEIAGKKTEALAKYVAGSVNELIPPKEYLTMILGMSDDDAQAVMDAAEKFGKKIEDEERDMEEEPSENPEDVIIEGD